jgi:hypothetical protein
MALIIQQRLAAKQNTSSTPYVADELERLAALRERGVLSPGEFERAKAKLLDMDH